VIKRIEDHNRLNGYLFVTIEFALIVAVIAPFGIYWLGHQKWLLAAVAVGIVANCLAVFGRSLRSLVQRERGVGFWKVYTDPVTRKQVAAEHPNLSADTAILAILCLLPFVLATAVARETVFAAKR
jgi:hypothetical protein